MLDAIDHDDNPVSQREPLAESIMELMDAGMQYFFLDTVESFQMGFVVTQAANLGVLGVVRIMAPTVRNIIGRMDKGQLRQVSKIMRRMMQ